jgi:hypothetical protein
MTPEDQLKAAFPFLTGFDWQISSPKNVRYNCIAWAADDEKNYWWPGGPYWPDGVPEDTSVDAFIEAFESRGFEVCKNGDIEEGFKKIAIYALRGEVRHAAKQKKNGLWSSKLGKDHDIVHELDAVAGPIYGKVVKFMRKPVAQPSAPTG